MSPRPNPQPASFPNATQLSRRTFLRAAGISLTLPWLEIQRPSTLRAETSSETPRRMVCIMTNMGVIPEYFFPKEAGTGYESTRYLALLEKHRPQLTVFSGLSHPGVNGAHLTEKCFLSAAPNPGASQFRNSISVDQFAAEKLGRQTRFPSLVLMVGKRDLGLPSVTRDGVSIPPESDPAALYRKLFLQGSSEEVARRISELRRGRSLLDFVRTEAGSLGHRIGARDRERIDQYFTSIREMEVSLQASEAWEQRPKPAVDFPEPKSVPQDVYIEEQTNLMYDLLRLALQTDSTRIASIYLGPLLITPKIPGVSNQTHGLTHHGGNPDKIEQLSKIEETQFRCLNRLLTALQATQEAGAPLLDHTQILYGSNLGNANSHETSNLPILLAGGGFRHGQHLAFDRSHNTPLANLFVTMLQRLNLEVNRFASGTGTLRGLEARA
jgi:hypothetical protein